MGLRYGLQVGDVKRADRLVQNIGKVLCNEAIEPLERAEAQDPVIGQFSGRPGRWTKVPFVTWIEMSE